MYGIYVMYMIIHIYTFAIYIVILIIIYNKTFENQYKIVR